MSDTARDLLRNTAGLVNTRLKPEDQMGDTPLKGFIQLAFRDARMKLAERGHTHLRIEVDIPSVPAGTSILNSTSTPVLPAWVLEPIRLWERNTGTTNWIPMIEVLDHLPMNNPPTSQFGYWEFRDQALRFPPASVTIDVRLHAYSRLTELTMPLDVVGLPDLVNAVSYAAAALALGGDPFLEKKGNDALQSIANLNAHMKQSTPGRRRRFRRGIRLGR